MLFTDTKPMIMGILNVTPDSFSDGGKYLKPEDAIKSFEMVKILDPNNYDTYNLIGNLLLELGRYNEALENFDNILNLQPNNEEAIIRKDQTLGLQIDYNLGFQEQFQRVKVLKNTCNIKPQRYLQSMQ